MKILKKIFNKENDEWLGFKENTWYKIKGEKMDSYVYLKHLVPTCGYEQAAVKYLLFNDNGNKTLAHTFDYFNLMVKSYNEIDNIPPQIEAKFLLLS